MVDMRLHGTKRDIRAKISILEKSTGLEILSYGELRPDCRNKGKYYLTAVLAAPEETKHRPRIRDIPF